LGLIEACRHVAYDGSLNDLVLAEDLFNDYAVLFNYSLLIDLRPLLIVEVVYRL